MIFKFLCSSAVFLTVCKDLDRKSASKQTNEMLGYPTFIGDVYIVHGCLYSVSLDVGTLDVACCNSVCLIQQKYCTAIYEIIYYYF